MNNNLTDEEKLSLIKRAISTKEGWKNLALSIKLHINPVGAKQKCIEALEEIGGDKEIEMKTVDSIPVNIKMSELLVRELEENLSKV
jgi:hypothetical protein